MIPGEVSVADGEIELNVGRKTMTLDGHQQRRPADSSRFALPFF